MLTHPDVSYEIDVSKPFGSRIVNLSYKGAAVSPTAEFIVATNNYPRQRRRPSPGLRRHRTIFASPDTNREVLINM